MVLTLLIALVFSAVASAEMNVPIQLRLKSPGGAYPTETNLIFKLVILTPASGCILREEDFSGQTITNGSVSLNLGSGVRGLSDPALSLNQIYDNSKTKTGLTCVDASNNIVSSGQSYVPAGSDGRIIRVLTTIGGDPVLANFNIRATPYAIQAESVGGKSASDLIVKDLTSQMNQTNLNDLLLDVTRFNNLKSIATSGQATSATTATTAISFSGALAGDVSGTQITTSVNKIKGVAVSATAPTVGQVLQYDGAQYVPSNLASGSVVSVAGKSGIVTLVSSDISGFGDAAGMNVGTAAGTVAAGNDSRLVSAYSDTLNATALNTASTLVKRDASGNVAATNFLSSNNSTNNLYLYDGVNSLRLKAPAGLAANYIFTLPGDDGTVGQLLRTDGLGNLTWVTGAGGGTVMGVTASAPLASSGGTNPNLTITQASMSSAGFLSSSDWTNFNSKQANLGFTPLDAAFFNAAVASASCSPSQSLYWNSITSDFQCQSISFPASAVTSVAGKTGAVTLVSSDISGLGGAAALNVGTAAGTVAAGNDSRILNAVQTSSAFSGDVSGTSSTVTVNKIRGTAVSASVPANGDVLQFNGTQYVPVAIPSAPVSSVAGRTGAIVLASSDISGLNFGTTAGTFAQGNDSRVVNAVQTSSAFSGDVTGTSTTNSVVKIRGTAVSASAPINGDVLQFNGTQYVPAAIPTAPVSSVAGRIGVVTLSSADISGLGGAAGLNVGTAAGTVAAGNDSRMVNAVQTSSAFSGDVTGTSTTNSVVKIRGTVVSASAPINGDVLQFNGTQYVPAAIPTAPVSTVAGRTGAIVLASSDISGLNFGTTVGTFAQGNDARFASALQSSAFNGYVASASCTTSQSLYWNSVSSQFLCQNISFPAVAVSSVAGRTGAIVLSSSDISGLGNSAGLNVGTTASTVAAGNDSRIVNAVQTSSAFSGDVTGTLSAVSVNKLRGVNISATAPVNGDVLQFNGTQYVPIAIPSAPVSTVAGRTGAIVLSSSDISGLGGAAGLNVGTTASTVAAGNDSRIVNAVQTSSTFSGDVTGTLSALSVNRLRGINISVTAPANGEILQFNGTQYVPIAIPSAPVSTVAGRTGAIVLSSSDISGLGGAAGLNAGVAATNLVQLDGSGKIPLSTLPTSVITSATLASATATGALSSADWSTFNSKQNSLGFVPLNSASNLSDLGSVITARTNLGLGGAAILNVGTTAGTVAAGNDSRITGALQNSVFNGYVTSASCTTSQSLYWNSVSSQFLCQGIAFPSAPVSTVAGRTGAVVLSSSDISGLGNSAGLNLGTAASNVAAGNDARFFDARAPNGTAAGDLSGTYPNPTVASVGGVTAANVASGTNAANVATNLNTASTIVKRDASGNFTAGTITAILSGNATTATTATSFSGALVGDVTGAQGATSVDKIKSTAVSAAASSAGQFLIYNGTTQYVPLVMSGDATMTSGGIVTIGAGSITSGKILDGTIVNNDISATAAIDATKIGGGLVNNTEYSYLAGVTSALQTQLNAKLNLSGGTMTGTLITRAPAAAAGSAPLKIPAGTVMTTPEAGAIETTGTVLYYTDSTAVRRSIPLQTVVKKTVTQNVNNSTTLVNDNAFAFTAAANTEYHVKIVIKASTNGTAMTLKWTFALPSGTMEVSGLSSNAGVTTAGSWVGGASGTLSSPIPALSNTANTQVYIVEGLISVGATGGPVTLQWAQNAGVTANLSFMAGSFMIYEPL